MWTRVHPARAFALVEGADLFGVNGDIILNGVKIPAVAIDWKGGLLHDNAMHFVQLL
jgi:hypothetical protein